MKKILLGFILFGFGLTGFIEAAVFYVREGASGNGTNWANAFGQLPGTLERGATYYFADGNNYGPYTFDDTGSEVITIKKAISNARCTSLGKSPSDCHGPTTDWQDSYGDGQAIFRGSGGLFTFRSHNYVIDGVVRDEDDWSNGSQYGFVMAVTNPAGAKIFGMSWEQPNDVWNGASNVIIKNVHASFSNVCYTNECYLNNIIATNNSQNVTLANSLLENISWHAALRINGVNGLFVEKNYFRNIFMKELISDQSGSRNVTFANNICENIAGTGAILSVSGSDWKIYNNVFFNPDSRYSFSDGVVIGSWTNQDRTISNFKVFGNTFYKLNGGASLYAENGSGNEARNNLFIGYTPGYTIFSNSNNTHNAPISTVVNANGGDFHLTAKGAQGLVLSSPYNKDLDGKVRGPTSTDWEIGAYEFGGSVPNPNQNHPADTGPGGAPNSKIEPDEATAFGLCWKTNCKPEATMNIAVRAGTLWNASADGEYRYDLSAGACPLCWVIVP